MAMPPFFKENDTPFQMLNKKLKKKKKFKQKKTNRTKSTFPIEDDFCGLFCNTLLH